MAVLAAVSVLGTLWFIAAFGAAGRLGPLVRTGVLGGLTIVGWAVTLFVGPVAAVQLWRFRESGRRAGIIFFGSGVAYYVVGFPLRSPEASIKPILVLLAMFTAPLLVLLSRRARPYFGAGSSKVAG